MYIADSISLKSGARDCTNQGGCLFPLLIFPSGNVYPKYTYIYTYQYALGKHRSNALELVHQYPVIEVDGDMAICDGGGGALGHPLEYISLQRGPGHIEYCKYCSLRYTQKAGSKGHH
jgi:uncharacterized Zn-finger protein